MPDSVATAHKIAATKGASRRGFAWSIFAVIMLTGIEHGVECRDGMIFGVHPSRVYRHGLTALPLIPANHTVKLSVVLQLRVAQAMARDGFTVWAEFCRVALNEKCRLSEDRALAGLPIQPKPRGPGTV